MRVLEASRARKAKTSGEGRQDDLGDGVAATDGILENLEIAAVLHGGRDLGAVALDFITRNLEHLVTVLGSGCDTRAAADRLVPEQAHWSVCSLALGSCAGREE